MAKKIIKLLLLLLIAFQYSCKSNKKDDICHKLTGGECKYWIYLNSYTNAIDTSFANKNIISAHHSEDVWLMSFHRNGEFYSYFKSCIFSKVFKNDFSKSHILVSNTWQYVNDTTVLIQNSPNIIDYVDDNTLIIHRVNSQIYNLWVVAPESFVNKDFRYIYERVRRKT